MSKRLIAYPDGLPAGDHRAWCDELVCHLGGDIRRVFDSPDGSLITFLRQASRARAFRDPRNEALVVLTRTKPLALTLPARHRLEQEFPIFKTAIWALYWDPEKNPELVDEARELGSMREDMHLAPIWTASRGERFIVLSPYVLHPELLAERGLQARAIGSSLVPLSGIPGVGEPLIIDRTA